MLSPRPLRLRGKYAAHKSPQAHTLAPLPQDATLNPAPRPAYLEAQQATRFPENDESAKRIRKRIRAASLPGRQRDPVPANRRGPLQAPAGPKAVLLDNEKK